MTDHLAIMRDPWFQFVAAGHKPIEARASEKLIAPHGAVEKGDRIYMKKVGFPIVPFFVPALRVEDYKNRYPDDIITEKLTQYQKELKVDAIFIRSKRDTAMYLTLIWLGPAVMLEKPFEFHQKGRRTWIVNYKPEEWK